MAPIKKVTLPRLELLAALVGARLLTYVAEALARFKMDYTLWTDSTIALTWIKSVSVKWKPFVANRVKEINEKTDSTKWRYCPGKDNPADLLTRGASIEKIISTQAWWHGPAWLTDKDMWPSQAADCTTECEPWKQKR